MTSIRPNKPIRGNIITNSMSMANIPTLNTASDFNQWLHAMKMVARLPGGTPPEFRRKVENSIRASVELRLILIKHLS